MTKKETMENFTLDEIKARRKTSGMNPALYQALTDAEVSSALPPMPMILLTTRIFGNRRNMFIQNLPAHASACARDR